MSKKIELGQTVMTRGIADKIEKDDKFAEFVKSSLEKYINCDWGDTCTEDKANNNYALKTNDRILAVYKSSDTTIWIITEWDRSVTTILFPEEY